MSPARRGRGAGALYQTSDGLWRGSVDLGMGGDGKRRRKVVSSKDYATAARKLRDLVRQVDDGQAPTADRTTVTQWLTHWLDTIATPTLRPTTRASYRGTITHHLLPHLGAYRLAALTPTHIRAMHRAVLAAHPDGRGERNAQLAHRVLSKALTDAVAEGVITRNPCEPVRPPAPKASTRGALTNDQAKRLLITAAQADDPMASRWAAALLLGARQGELLGLQWDRVDLDRGTVDLAWQLQSLPRDPAGRFDVPPGYEYQPLHESLCLVRPKSKAGTRLVPLPLPLAAVLAEHKAAQPPNPWGLLWVTHDRYTQAPTPVHRKRDYLRWRAACAAADIPPVPLHSARHTTATLLLEAGVDAHVIASILGHTNVAVTRGYQHVDLSLGRAAMAHLGQLLAG